MIDPVKLEEMRRALATPEADRERLADEPRCIHGHPLDGVKNIGHGKTRRYCITCNREWNRAASWQPRDRGTLGPCLKCKTTPLSVQNKSGLCLKCWNEVGPVTRAFYGERFIARRAA